MSDSDSTPQAPLRLPRARRNTNRLRIFGWCLAALLTLLLVAIVVGVLWMRSAARASLPQLDGDLHLVGLSAPVTVRRDAHGVPHVQAASQPDLFLAQGYLTAQERLWQMDAFRRNANGDLAEVMGSALVAHDKMQRVLQIRLTAERIYNHLPAEERARWDTYARGVNLYIAQAEASNSLPVEFKLLRYQPRPWTGADSVSVGLMEVQELDFHAETKLTRALIAAKLNDPQLEADLYPVGSWRDHPPTGISLDLTQPRPMPPASEDEDDEENTEARLSPNQPQMNVAQVAELREAADLLSVQPLCDGCAWGSNNWVISGKHTANGKPLLSNDMHLPLTEPNIWYMADLSAPGFHAAGVTLPGVPFVVAGHNDHVAWGLTALMADVQDLYIEKLDGKGNYEGNDGQWHPLAVDYEVIHVRGGKDATVDVQSTEHGPLVNSISGHAYQPIALKWTIYDATLNEIPLYKMDVASNWEEFSSALEDWVWPTQNVVYSDDQGHIAYHAIGKVPIRGGGQTPLPIHDNAHEWQAYIPFEGMPNAFDPPSGFLATANSRVTTEQSPYQLTDEWIDPYRIERIYKMLDGHDNLTPADMLTVQTDVYSELDQEMGHRLAYAIDHTDGPSGNGDERMRKAADLMRTWDGRVTTDSAAASFVTQARTALWPLILEPKLGKDAANYHWGESNFAEEEIVMHAKPAWLPKKYKNWDALLTDAVRKGMDSGKAPSDVARWTYGSWHVVDIEHPLAAFLPLVGRTAGTGRQPMSGDTTTVKQIGKAVGPSQRFTMDWSNIDGSTENIVLGESSNPYSPYFRDQWNAWYNGTTFALPFSPSAVSAQTTHTLRLVP